MKIFRTSILLLLVVVFMVSCGVYASDENKIEEINSEESNKVESSRIIDDDDPLIVFPEKGISGPLGFAFFSSADFSHDLQDLFDEADAIILGIVVGDDVQYRNEGSELENALSDVKVKEVWKGDLKDDDIITIHETGWRLDNDQSLSIGGEPILRTGMRVILFLTSPYGKERWIVNSFQGKFFIDEKGIVHSYQYYSSIYEFGFLEDVGEIIPLEEFEILLDSLSGKQ